jgi:transposase
MRERKEFGREFKLEAIRQLEEGRKNPAELARELGIRRNQLYKWKEQKEEAAGRPFPGSGHRKGSEAEEIARRRREVEQLRQENEILKKAAAFFARELKVHPVAKNAV